MKIKSLLALLMAMALLMGCVSVSVAEEAAPLAAGDTLADFTWTACDGTAYTLSEALEGKELALIVLWTVEGNELSFLQEAYAGAEERVAVFAICVDDDAADDALATLADELGLTFPVGQDSAGIAALVQPEALPTVIAVAADGVVASIQSGSLESVNGYKALMESAPGAEEAEAATPVPPAPIGMSNYTLRYVDQNGDPVEGLIANICDDSACMPMFTDAKGTIFFQYPSFAYHIQVIRIPEGYEYDLTEESYLDADGGKYTFVVTKK